MRFLDVAPPDIPSEGGSGIWISIGILAVIIAIVVIIIVVSKNNNKEVKEEKGVQSENEKDIK